MALGPISRRIAHPFPVLRRRTANMFYIPADSLMENLEFAQEGQRRN